MLSNNDVVPMKSSAILPFSNPLLSSASPPLRTMIDAVRDQYPTADGWICPKCVHHQGGLSCDVGIFIAYVGGNTSKCISFAFASIPQPSIDNKEFLTLIDKDR